MYVLTVPVEMKKRTVFSLLFRLSYTHFFLFLSFSKNNISTPDESLRVAAYTLFFFFTACAPWRARARCKCEYLSPETAAYHRGRSNQNVISSEITRTDDGAAYFKTPQSARFTAARNALLCTRPVRIRSRGCFYMCLYFYSQHHHRVSLLH